MNQETNKNLDSLETYQHVENHYITLPKAALNRHF